MRPSDEQVQGWCDVIRKATRPINGTKGPSPLDLLERDLVKAMKRDKGPAPANDGYSSGPGVGRGGSELTSVEAAADARIEGKTVRDELHESVTASLDQLHQCVLSLRAVANRVEEINRRAALDKPTAHKAAATCQEKFCEDTADKAGRCHACYMWKRREAERRGCTIPELGPVPESVINSRLAERENRKVHTTGPEAVGA